jgi:hypothetical protein
VPRLVPVQPAPATAYQLSLGPTAAATLSPNRRSPSGARWTTTSSSKTPGCRAITPSSGCARATTASATCAAPTARS